MNNQLNQVSQEIVFNIEQLITKFRDLKNIHVCEEISLINTTITTEDGDKYQEYIKETKFKIFKYNERLVFENYKLLYEATIKETFSTSYLNTIYNDLSNIYNKIMSE